MNPQFLINGKPCEQISVQDRGLHYGDGLFETLAVNDFRVLSWSRHLQRLQYGCEQLGIECPETGLIESEVGQLTSVSSRSVIKIIVTRGEGGRGYRVPERSNTTRIVALYPWPEFLHGQGDTGIRVQICATRLTCNRQLAGIKHLNRLDQVLARKEWTDPEIAEGIMMDATGHVIEGTMSNLFLFRQGELYTPDLSECGIAGVTRANILDLAPTRGGSVQVKKLTLEELLTAEEVFLCNSIIGIWPVREIDNHRFHTGPRTRVIKEAMAEAGFIVAL